MENLPDQRGLRDGDKVAIHLHLYDAVDCLDVDFLNEVSVTFLKF